MYQPKHFQQTDKTQLHALIAAHPLATLIVQGTDGPDVNLVPLLFDSATSSTDKLIGHVASANPLAAMNGVRVLVLFHGPNGYISPSFYPSKQAHGKVVPTWNYAIVEGRGTLRTFDAPEALLGIVDRLTRHFEADSAKPWQVSDAPADFVPQILKGITGIEIELDSLIGKFKLSQNRSAEDRAGVIAGLNASGKPDAQRLAELMSQAN